MGHRERGGREVRTKLAGLASAYVISFPLPLIGPPAGFCFLRAEEESDPIITCQPLPLFVGFLASLRPRPPPVSLSFL